MNEATHWLVTYNKRKVKHTKWYIDKNRTKFSANSNIEKGPWITGNCITALPPIEWFEDMLNERYQDRTKGYESVYISFNTFDIVFLSAIRVRWSTAVEKYLEEE